MSDRTQQARERADYNEDDAAVIWLAVYAVLCDDMSPENAVAFARKHQHAMRTRPEWADGRHLGDCTKTPMSCARCQYEDAIKQAAVVYEHDPTDLVDRVAALETALRKIQDVYGTDDCTCIVCTTCRDALAGGGGQTETPA